MPFFFTLAPLLRLRQSIERQKTMALQAANLALMRGQEQLTQLDAFLSDSAGVDREGLAAGRRGAELQFAAALRENMQRVRRELQAEICNLELVRQQAAGAYHQAYRDREVLAALRIRQLADYRRERLRRQQQELDANYLLQRWHRPM
jgi:flagellar export protein FliJ